MKLYVNKDNKIMAINATERTDLTEIILDENEMDFPFNGWSETRICCYKIDYTTEIISEERDEEGNIISQEKKHHITMMTPYINSETISIIDDLYIKSEQRNTDLDLQNIALEQRISELELDLQLLEEE